MGVIQIRMQQQRLGNLPGMRAVDTSPVAQAAANQALAIRSVGQGIAGLGQAIPQAASALAAMQEEDNRNEANKLMQAYVSQMDFALNGAAHGGSADPDAPAAQPNGLFIAAAEDDTQARRLIETLGKTAADTRRAIGLDRHNPRVNELFEQAVFAYDRGNAAKANAIMARRFDLSRQTNAKAAEALALQTAVSAPTAESFDAYARALDDRLNAEHLPQGDARNLAVQTAQRGLLAAILANRASDGDLTRLSSEIDALKAGTLPASAMDEASQAFLAQTFGSLQPAERQKLIRALETQRDTLAADTLAALDNAQFEGRAAYPDILAARDAMRRAKVPEATVRKANAILDNQRARDINAAIAAIPDDITDAQDEETARRSIAAYELTLPTHVTESKEWAAFRRQAERLSPKAAVALKKEDGADRLSQILNRWTLDADGLRVPTDLGQSEQLAALDLLWRTGQIDDAQLEDGRNKVAAFWDARSADLMRQTVQAGNFAEALGLRYDWENVRNDANGLNLATLGNAFAFGKDGLDAGQTAKNLAGLFDTATDTDAQRKRRLALIKERLDKASTAFAAAVAQNPTWTAEQCRTLWRELLREPLYALGNERFEMDPDQVVRWQRSIGAMWLAAEPAGDNRDYDPDAVLKAFQNSDLTLAPSMETEAPALAGLTALRTEQDAAPDANTPQGDPAAGRAAEPAQEPADGAPARYATGEGEDLVQVALKWGVTVSELRKLNPSLPQDRGASLPPGTVIRLPAYVANP